MKVVWTDTNEDRATISLSKKEIDMVRQALDTESAQLTCMSALNNVTLDRDEETLEEQASFAENLKAEFDKVAEFMG